MQQPSMQHRRGRSLSSFAKERDEDLALFHEMQKRELEKKHGIRSPAHTTAGSPLASRTLNSSLSRIPASSITRMRGVDDLLTADSEKNDYDWLLTPPGTPLFSSLDHDTPGLGSPHKGTPLVRSLAALKTSRLANTMEPSSKLVSANLGSRQSNSNSSFSSASNLGSRQSSSSSSFSSATNLGSRQPSSSSCFSSSSNAPNRRPAFAPTPGTRATSRPSTPTGRASIPSTATRSASSSRPSTPTRRPATPTLRQNHPPGPTTIRSSSVSKASSLPSRSAASSRGTSPTTRTRPWQPSAMPGFSLEPPPNLRTTMPERAPSNQRGSSVSSRPGAPTAIRTSQAELPDANSRSRRQSCSPSVTRGRLSPGSQTRDPINTRTSKTPNCGVEVTVPVVIGSKILEKVMRARSTALSPEEQTISAPTLQMKQSVKPTTPTMRDTSGFGRNLSKKSLDMALRHMDIRRSTPNGFRPLISNIPASSLYSVRAGTGKTRPTNSAAGSPVATSSNASSEHSMSIVQEREGSEQGDDVGSEKASKASPVSQPDSASKDVRMSNWAGSPDYRDDNVELMQLFRQGIERFSGSESPLVSQNGEASEYGDQSKLGPRLV